MCHCEMISPRKVLAILNIKIIIGILIGSPKWVFFFKLRLGRCILGALGHYIYFVSLNCITLHLFRIIMLHKPSFRLYCDRDIPIHGVNIVIRVCSNIVQLLLLDLLRDFMHVGCYI